MADTNTKSELYGCTGKVLKVDLSSGSISEDTLDDATLQKFPGGTSLGAKILYEEVPPMTEWSDPENRLYMGSGPLGGTVLAGSANFTIMAKGPLTNGAAASQANGFFGAYLKLNEFDALVFHGASDKWVYLYIHDGVAELRHADHLTGKDTWEIQDSIAEELGKTERELSVYSIGPAGENMVRFACILGDKGHAAGHNGLGAVMGSKKLKAVAIERQKGTVNVYNPDALASLAKEIIEIEKAAEGPLATYYWGTSQFYSGNEWQGALPVRNYTLNTFPDHAKFMGENYRKTFEMKRNSCWHCPQHHCHIMKVTDGPYKGYEGEEPEYEQWVEWSCQIGLTDTNAAFVLCNEVDKMGLETNEAGWVVGWVMECYEKGLLSQDDLDGLDMTWGNVKATLALLKNITYRRGFGNILAEGVMRAAQHVGGETINFAVHTMKGNTPRSHDHRAIWTEMLNTCISSSGTIEERAHVALLFTPEEVVKKWISEMGEMYFEDSVGICWFNMGVPILLSGDKTLIVRAVNAATGWNMTIEDTLEVGRRAANVLRAFNLRNGITAELDAPSPRYGSTPQDGPAKGMDVKPHWDTMVRDYYERMGWDADTGIPLPRTLESLSIGHISNDLWP